MLKLALLCALVGLCAGVPVPQDDGFRGDEESHPNVLIHSGYANIRRQGRMHDSGSFSSGRYKKGRTLDIESIKTPEQELPDPAPVYKGSQEYEQFLGREKGSFKLETKLNAIEKMEKDILNAITSTTTSTTTSSTTEAEEPSSTPAASPPSTAAPPRLESTPPVTEAAPVVVSEEETTPAPPQTPLLTSTEEPLLSSAASSEAVPTTSTSMSSLKEEEATSTAGTTKEFLLEDTTLESIVDNSLEDLEVTSIPIVPSSALPTSTEALLLSTTKQQPSAEIDLGSVEEVIS